MQASRTVIHSADITFQMLEDWRNVDLNSITKQTLYTMEDSREDQRRLIIHCEDHKTHINVYMQDKNVVYQKRRLIKNYFSSFRITVAYLRFITAAVSHAALWRKTRWLVFCTNQISHSSCQPALNHSHDHESRALTTDTERLTLTVWHPEEHFKFISASTPHMTDQVKVQRFCHVILKRGFWLSLHTVVSVAIVNVLWNSLFSFILLSFVIKK